MSSRTIQMNDALGEYLVRTSVREPETMQRLREETARLPGARMQISPEQGAFMGWLVGLMGARRAIEIGTYTGYSAMAVARAMPEGGRLLCCDVERDYTDIAQRYWREAGLDDRIELRIAPAVETLDALIARGGAGVYDLAFIDADKESYDAYYERCLVLLRAGGVVLVDNVLWSGKVADPTAGDESTKAIRALNEKVFADTRVDACMVPIGDGLALARKR